jgi:hypothetical protein
VTSSNRWWNWLALSAVAYTGGGLAQLIAAEAEHSRDEPSDDSRSAVASNVHGSNQLGRPVRLATAGLGPR